jgi:dolichol kinase
MVIIEYLKYDFLITIPLFLWVLFVMKIVSRWVFDFAIRKGYPPNSATYFGRKTIHILASGVAALLIPILYKEPLIPFLSAIVLAIYTYLPHKKNQLNQWYQAKDNTKEVNFSIMWGISILVGWYFDRTFWLGVIPVLFMSFGDGITGIIRNIIYKKRTKAWEGSVGMFVVCVIIGLRIGSAGIVAAIFATIIEKLDFMDDNISVPVVSLIILIFFKSFFPSLTQSFF